MSIKVANIPTTRAELRIPWRGCWELRATFIGAMPSGRVAVDWRGWGLTGTIDAERSGTFQGESRVVIVGGLGWSRPIVARHWNADQGLRVDRIAQDLARQAGESISIQSTAQRPLGKYFLLRRETAGAALSRLLGPAFWWWVSTNGTTQAGVRTRPALGQGVAVLSYDATHGEAAVHAPRPDAVPIGSVITSDRLPGGRRVVRELIAVADGKSERVRAHTEAL